MAESEDRVVPLADGSHLRLRVLEPPLATYGETLEYWWRDVRDDLLAGRLAESSRDRFIVGEVAGDYVASMTYCVPRSTRDLAVLGMVWTRPDQRRKGIARILLDYTLADFRAGGGVAMHLCTTNPHAYALYSQLGFRPLIGDGMRYLAPGHDDFDHTFYAFTGPAQVRPAQWGDLARLCFLYNQPQPDWLVKDYGRRVFRDVRYEGHFRQLWLPAQRQRASLLVLENPLQRVVGIASLLEMDSYAEQHVQQLDFWAAPAYLHQLSDLLHALADLGGSRGAAVLQATVAAPDQERQQILRDCGYQLDARLPSRLRVGTQLTDLLIFSRTLTSSPSPHHPPNSYYGARPAFQTGVFKMS